MNTVFPKWMFKMVCWNHFLLCLNILVKWEKTISMWLLHCLKMHLLTEIWFIDKLLVPLLNIWLWELLIWVVKTHWLICWTICFQIYLKFHLMLSMLLWMELKGWESLWDLGGFCYTRCRVCFIRQDVWGKLTGRYTTIVIWGVRSLWWHIILNLKDILISIWSMCFELRQK